MKKAMHFTQLSGFGPLLMKSLPAVIYQEPAGFSESSGTVSSCMHHVCVETGCFSRIIQCKRSDYRVKKEEG